MYRIYVYAICKNEEKFAERWVRSMQEADGICVLDTGSTDGTAERLRELGAHVTQEAVTPQRLAAEFSWQRVRRADISVGKPQNCL